MLAAERKREIKNIILEKKSATVSSLAKRFSVTDETIRRDLKALEKEGVLMRTYGGAYIQSGVENLLDIDLRKTLYIEEKEAIAKRCRQLIEAGDTIFLDNSTTCFYIARAIADLHVTVVTNNLMIINLFSTNENVKLISVGGDFSLSEQAFCGTIATRILGSYYFDKAFISCRTLSIDNGVTESTDQWAMLRHQVIERSDLHYLVADHTKFDKTSFVRICGFEDITAIVTDRALSGAWHDAAGKLGCAVIDGTE